MKKWFIVLIITVLIIIASFVYQYNVYKNAALVAKNLNEEYENFTKTDLLGTSLITLINKTVDLNKKNNIKLNSDELFIENETNSIKIDVKFIESEETYPMEKIEKLGSEQFIRNYASASFRCTQKQYHEKNNNIKYLLFEQI